MSFIFTNKQKKNSSAPIIFLLCILFLTLGIGAFVLAFSQAATDVDDSISKETESQTGQLSLENADENSDDATLSEQVQEQEQEVEATITNAQSKYDYADVVPVTEGAAIEYLDDAAFLGDSITEGMKLHNQSNAFISSATSMAVIGAMNNPQATYGDMTLLEAVNDKSPKKIYVMLGSNEVGGYGMDIYISRYSELIDSLKSSNPDSIIYVQSLTPVTKAYHDGGHILNNDLVNDANAQLKLLAFEKKVFFLDINSALVGEDGFLPDDASPKDGVHFGTDYFNKWMDYILSHTIDYDMFIAERETYFDQ